MLNIKNKKKLLSLLVTGFVLLQGNVAKANTEVANKELNDRSIVYEMKDSISTNLVMNAEDVLMNTKTNGLDNEYKDLILDETLILNSVNQMRENILNYNISNLFNNKENYSYLSMGIYLDREEEKEIILNISKIVEEFSINPTNTNLLDRLINIFAGNDKDLPTALLSVGGKQALANDIYYLNALVQVYEIEDYKEVMNNIAYSFGDNGDIIAFIEAINGEKCNTK